jgi:hypothetical protein
VWKTLFLLQAYSHNTLHEKNTFCLLPVICCIGLRFCRYRKHQHFVVKENPFAKDEIALVAVDTASNIQENVNGTFNFTINGFSEELKFEKGTAFYRHKLDKSSFIFARHQNDEGTTSMLYYVYRHDSKLTPLK